MAAKAKVKYSDLQRKAAQRNQIIHLIPPRLERSRILVTSGAEIKLKGLASYFTMRERWSHCLMIAIFIVLGFNILMVWFVGIGTLMYSDEWFLRIVLTTNLADIIGLAVVIVKFLFPNQNNLLEMVSRSTEEAPEDKR